ncbi:DUF1963 domain-containing protein [Corynebacterium glaucum]|uniref:DUF1963 domain-containing protein n=1 Tax=Corynebacterium glaucum TaxID=187491 RepID=UPI0025B43123|nr:DUF1963 domain-containing protein [Corynebacterium glaucum]WJZ07017.1 hypothetical protein CGLAUT_02555 [Corynebacterium glaucum]
MFESRERALTLAEEILPESIRTDVLRLLTPAIGLKPAQEWGKTTLGRTRIGGTPDGPEGFEWPGTKPTADDLALLPDWVEGEQLESISNEHSLTFIGQIDLEEAHALGDTAGDLPDTGRLLFFWDFEVGVLLSIPEATRVIWDTTPKDQITTAPLADDLRAAHEAFQRDFQERFSMQYESSSYFTPGRDATLYDSVMLPRSHANLFEVKDAIARIEESEQFGEFYEFSDHDDEFGDPYWHKYQVLGLPHSIQTEPRKYLNEFGTFVGNPAAWRLLFQVPFGDWQKEHGEGEIYFLIRADALARRDFSDVRTVYQQT